jgi:hypothetical protein
MPVGLVNIWFKLSDFGFYYIHFTCYVYLAWGKFDAKLHSGLRLLKVNGNENIVWVRSGFGFFSILTTLYWRTTGSLIVYHVMRRRLFWGFRDSRQCLGRKCFGFIFWYNERISTREVTPVEWFMERWMYHAYRVASRGFHADVESLMQGHLR